MRSNGHRGACRAILPLVVATGVLFSCSVTKEDAFAAAAEGNLSAVERFVSADAGNVDARDDFGNTLLSASIRAKRTEIADWLIEKGADVNAADKGGMKPLHVAAVADNVEAVASLARAGVDLNGRNPKDRGKTALHYAAINGSLRVAEFLVDAGVDVDVRCSVKATPLSWAAYTGTLETVKFFVSKGADTTAKDSYGDSILGAAKNGKKTDIYDYLVSIGVR